MQLFRRVDLGWGRSNQLARTTAAPPRTRRKLYMGHAIGDVTDLYEQHEVAAFLSEDAAKLEQYARAGEKETLKLEGKQA